MLRPTPQDVDLTPLRLRFLDGEKKYLDPSLSSLSFKLSVGFPAVGLGGRNKHLAWPQREVSDACSVRAGQQPGQVPRDLQRTGQPLARLSSEVLAETQPGNKWADYAEQALGIPFARLDTNDAWRLQPGQRWPTRLQAMGAGTRLT